MTSEGGGGVVPANVEVSRARVCKSSRRRSPLASECAGEIRKISAMTTAGLEETSGGDHVQQDEARRGLNVME